MKITHAFLIFAVGFGLLARPQAGATENELKSVNLTFALSINSFSDVNRNDAEAALKTFTAMGARKRGYLLDYKSHVFEDPTAYQTAIREGKFNAAVIDAWDYLGADLASYVDISFVKERGGTVGEQYVLLTRRDSGLNSVADLRNREIAVLESSNAKLSRRWTDFVVLTNRLGDPAHFFAKVVILHKPSPVLLPVFFGKRPACVITRSAFDVMSQLNPQLSRDLQVIASSPTYLESFLCMARSGWDSEDFKRAFVEGVLNMGDDPAGQQILNLFKADHFVAFEPAQLETVRQFRTDYERLSRENIQ